MYTAIVQILVYNLTSTNISRNTEYIVGYRDLYSVVFEIQYSG